MLKRLAQEWQELKKTKIGRKAAENDAGLTHLQPLGTIFWQESFEAAPKQTTASIS